MLVFGFGPALRLTLRSRRQPRRRARRLERAQRIFLRGSVPVFPIGRVFVPPRRARHGHGNPGSGDVLRRVPERLSTGFRLRPRLRRRRRRERLVAARRADAASFATARRGGIFKFVRGGMLTHVRIRRAERPRRTRRERLSRPGSDGRLRRRSARAPRRLHDTRVSLALLRARAHLPHGRGGGEGGGGGRGGGTRRGTRGGPAHSFAPSGSRARGSSTPRTRSTPHGSRVRPRVRPRDGSPSSRCDTHARSSTARGGVDACSSRVHRGLRECGVEI